MRYYKVASKLFGRMMIERQPTVLHFLQITKNFGLLWETRDRKDRS